MRRGTKLSAVLMSVVALVLLAVLPVAASALAPPSPWDGTNPFRCTVQDAGLGTTVPDPDADPYCVHFDKTEHNITQLGIVDFLSKEPARAAAAVPKCFYDQEDHWRGSIVQSDPSTVLYEFTGHYFFDKATGDGGAWVTGFSIAGQTFDPTSLPGFPPAYGRYFGPGTGGVITHDDIPLDPRCLAMAQRGPSAIYAAAPRCVPAVGAVDRHGVGPVTLGMTEDRLRAELGSPQSVKRGFLAYCAEGGGRLLVGQPGDRSGTLGAGRDPAVMLLTTSGGFGLAGGRGPRLTVGSSAAALRRAFPHTQQIGRLGSTSLAALGRGVLAGIAARRIVMLGSYDPRTIASTAAVLNYVRRAG